MSCISLQWRHLVNVSVVVMCAIALSFNVLSLNVHAQEESTGDASPAEAAVESTESGSPAEAEPHEHDAEAHGAEADHGGEHAAGEVKSPIEFKEDLAIWSLIVFVLTLIVLKKFAWGPLSTGLNTREANIRQDIAAAEEARQKSERMLAEHSEKLDKAQDEVRELIAEARRDAEHTKQEILAEAQREAEATKKRVTLEMDRARQAAEKHLIDMASSLVANATEHVLNRSLTGEDQDRLIEEALSQLSS